MSFKSKDKIQLMNNIFYYNCDNQSNYDYINENNENNENNKNNENIIEKFTSNTSTSNSNSNNNDPYENVRFWKIIDFFRNNFLFK